MSREQLLQRILLIDANPVDRALTVQALSDNLPGVDIEKIVNADELAQAIAVGKFDLAIADYKLPWTTGLDVLRTIKAQMQNCPVIMFTNSGSEEIAVAAMKAGLDDYIIKSPENLMQLVQAVRHLWQNSQIRSQVDQALPTNGHKAAETALQESQQLYQTLVENSPDIIERFDTQLRHLYTSPSLTQITGIPAEVFIGRTCRELSLSEAMVNTWEAAAQELLKTGQRQIIEVETPSLKGVRSYEMAIAPELTRDNRIESILCISRDITERKAAQIALQRQAKQEQTLNRIVQSIRSSLDLTTIFSTAMAEVTQLLELHETAIVQYLPERECWKILAVHRQNASVTDTTGLEIPDQDNPYAAKLKQFQVVHINNMDSITDPINQKIATMVPPAWLLTPIAVNGKIWGCLTLVKPAEDAPWKPEEVELARQLADQLAIAIQQAQLYQQMQQELAERQRAEAALQQLNQELEQRVQERTTQLKMALAAAKMGTWEWNLQTNTVHWSPEEYELFGFQTDAQGRVLDENGTEISPHPTFELFVNCVDPNDRDYILREIHQAIEKGSSFEIEYRLLPRNGMIHWLYARGAYLSNPQGQPLALMGIAMDITNRKQAEVALQQQARQEKVLRLVTQEIRQSLDLDAILATAVSEIRQTLQADRVAVYRFNADWSGNFIVESVGPGWVQLVKPNIKKVWEDTYLQETQGGRYKNHESFAVTDIYTVGHQHCHIALLEQFQARAYAIAPIFSGDYLWGLLAVYQNTAPRDWQSWEMELLQQITDQLAIAIQQSQLYKQLQIELQERRQIEEQIRASLKEKEVLLREVYHRVKNNMQMVSSLLNLQASSIDDPNVLKLLSESQRRVKTMALVHERLYRSENLAQINFATYVKHLVKDLVRSYTSKNSLISVFTTVDELELDLDTAVPCGLIINELISNALKYAFPNDQGEITLQFWLYDPEYYCLIVKDNGIGIPDHIDPLCTTSLGMQLIHGLTEQLGGTLQLDRQGGSQFKILLRKRL